MELLSRYWLFFIVTEREQSGMLSCIGSGRFFWFSEFIIWETSSCILIDVFLVSCCFSDSVRAGLYCTIGVGFCVSCRLLSLFCSVFVSSCATGAFWFSFWADGAGCFICSVCTGCSVSGSSEFSSVFAGRKSSSSRFSIFSSKLYSIFFWSSAKSSASSLSGIFSSIGYCSSIKISASTLSSSVFSVFSCSNCSWSGCDSWFCSCSNSEYSSFWGSWVCSTGWTCKFSWGVCDEGAADGKSASVEIHEKNNKLKIIKDYV